jgi:hypothetical protein
MPDRNGVKTAKFPVSLDEVSERVLQRMVPAGIFGKNRGEVASWMIRDWIWQHPLELERLGISVRNEMGKPA